MLAVLFEMLKLLAIDLVFVGILVAVLVPLANYKKAAFAVLKRNFIGYFSNPTGYVFLCLFVLLTSLAAFWPHEFFVANLANLDQLNKAIAPILLIFVPAITMSIWAEERRQGTDELLLTLPAADFDIVIGKYLAAAAIFTVSLIFSQIANYWVLVSLTNDPTTGQVDLDTGLFFTTYFGYWLIGLSMIALGMVASFLTNNLTVGFILGLIFNSILVLTQYADAVIPSASMAQSVSHWSFGAQFDDFGRGVVSLASTAFFLLLIALGVYLSMVLIGRRHWSGGRDGQSLWMHYLVRAASLVVLLIGVNMILERYDIVRWDLTEGRVSSLSPDTHRLLRELANRKDKRQVIIDAYISANVPDEYVKTKYNLVSMLKELERQVPSRIRVRLHDNLEVFSNEAAQAQERFGITKRSITSQSRGAIRQEEFLLGAAFTSGLEKVVVPFFGNGTPVEYELIRSITVASQGDQDKRKRLGIVSTDAQLSGGFTMSGMQPRQMPRQLILDELERQYKVEEVDPTNPIEPGKYDALLIVQPSSLGPQQLTNVVDTIRKGQPAAIFEDPFPGIMNHVVGTNQDKPQQGGMFGMGGGPPPPKGDIWALWKVLGIEPTGATGAGAPVPGEIVWQAFNPYPKIEGLTNIGPEFVFIRNDAPYTENAFNPDEPVVAGFEELLLPFPTGIVKASGSETEFTELVSTSSKLAGTIDMLEYQANSFDPQSLREKRGRPSGRKYVLAAWIQGAGADKADADKADGKKLEVKETAAKADADDKKTAAGSGKDKPINVIYVGDIDMLHSEFVMLRNQPNPEVNFRFDNIPFVLNVIDAVAGDERFLSIRQRKPRHSTLKMVEARAAEARDRENKEAEKFRTRYTEEEQKIDAKAKQASAELQRVVDDLRSKQNKGEFVDPGELQAKLQALALQQEYATRQSDVAKEQLKIDRDKNLARIQRERDQQVQGIQNEYKVWATVVPPIPPLLLGLLVWVRRRVREREGVSRSRMK